MGKDISKQTVVVLAVLTILISLLGTFTVLREVSSMGSATELPEGTPVQGGELRIAVKGEPMTSSSAGQISLNVASIDNMEQ